MKFATNVELFISIRALSSVRCIRLNNFIIIGISKHKKSFRPNESQKMTTINDYCYCNWRFCVDSLIFVVFYFSFGFLFVAEQKPRNAKMKKKWDFRIHFNRHLKVNFRHLTSISLAAMTQKMRTFSSNVSVTDAAASAAVADDDDDVDANGENCFALATECVGRTTFHRRHA